MSCRISYVNRPVMTRLVQRIDVVPVRLAFRRIKPLAIEPF